MIEPTDWMVTATHVLALCVGLWGGWIITLLRVRRRDAKNAWLLASRQIDISADRQSPGPRLARSMRGFRDVLARGEEPGAHFKISGKGRDSEQKG